MKKFGAAFLFCTALSSAIFAQRTGLDWMTDNADAQRSSWIRTDGKIRKDTVTKENFQFLWKMKVKNAPKGLNNLMPPSALDRLIGYRGFRMLGFFAGSSNNLITIDTDLGRLEWEKTLQVAPSTAPSTLRCPGGMTTGVARPALFTIPPAPTTDVVRSGRNTPAKSGVGEAGQGAVTLANVRPNPPRPAGPAPAQQNPPTVQQRLANQANPPGGQLGAGPFLVYALASDGKLHAMHLSNGADYQPPAPFIPANANATGLFVADQYAYVATQNGCNGVADGVWAMNLENKQVVSFKANITGSTGMAFDADGTLYVTTGSGGDKANSLVALDGKTLAVKSAFSAGAPEFSSSPVVFVHKNKTLIAATTKDGRVHIFESADLSKPIVASSATLKAADFAPGALASWQDLSGTRWILSAASAAQATQLGFQPTNGALTKGAVVAWKIVEANGALTLQPGWASRNLVGPLTPTIINGVVFAASSGQSQPNDGKGTVAQRTLRAGRAVFYALDGTSGKELWNSGTTMTSWATSGALSGGMSQIYVTTYDGTIYTFGFPMEH
jgi:outer membrane protein assembly factor BamB